MSYGKKLRRAALLLLPIIVCLYSAWYISHSHSELVNWYLGINDHFYQSGVWASQFFTPGVKTKGEAWCYIAMALSIVFSVMAWKFPMSHLKPVKISRKSLAMYSSIAVAGLVLVKISSNAAYAPDEVFSALNFASLPWFQCMSYYALPNNHVFII